MKIININLNKKIYKLKINLNYTYKLNSIKNGNKSSNEKKEYTK